MCVSDPSFCACGSTQRTEANSCLSKTNTPSTLTEQLMVLQGSK